MKPWFKKLSLIFGAGAWLLGAAWAAPPVTPTTTTTNQQPSAAIQAIQQAGDPSAVIAAYANGTVYNHTDPMLIEAYVSRMIDLGLPELAYHQAQTLTTIGSNSGLAYGVVAYVDARRGEMDDAISAINVAVPLAPDHKFIQATAGEIL